MTEVTKKQPATRRKKKRPTSNTPNQTSLAAKIAASEVKEGVDEVTNTSTVTPPTYGVKRGPLGNLDYVEPGSPEHAIIVLGLDPETHEPVFDLSNVTEKQAKKFTDERVRQLKASPPDLSNLPPMWNPDEDPNVTEVGR